MSVKRNLIANYIGQGWTTLMGLAFIPLYIKYIGIEAYGLIGIFTLLQAGLTLLDMGLSSTLSREMARFMGGAYVAETIRDLLRSVEVIALIVSCLIAAGMWLASDWLASEWLHTEKLPIPEVANALSIMGFVAALRFIEGIYRSSIVGLQHQVIYNIISSVMATLRWLGAVGVLAWISPTVNAFFLWQGIVSLLTVLVLGWLTYEVLPRVERTAYFSLSALKGIRCFAGGIMVITFLGLLLTQVDKILLSSILGLVDYGYYTLAAVLAGGLYMISAPIQTAYLPRLNELRASDDHKLLIQTYHRASQMVAVIVGSAAAILVGFSETILNLWTHDAELAARSAMLLSILSLGNLLNCLMLIPCQTQLTFGWTSLLIKINVVSIICIIPTILWVTPRFGAEGAAWTWVSLNVFYMFLGVHFMYRKILTTEKWRWYVEDVFQPLTAAAFIVAPSVWLMPRHMAELSQLAYIFMTSGFVLLASALATRELRLIICKYSLKTFNQL